MGIWNIVPVHFSVCAVIDFDSPGSFIPPITQVTLKVYSVPEERLLTVKVLDVPISFPALYSSTVGLSSLYLQYKVSHV